jgi:DNA-directed RNA polymerase subunit RPC12/RpoP
VLPPLNDFWDALPEIFTWMTSSAPVPQRAIIQHGIGEVAIRTRLLPIGVPLPARSTLEIIRFAAGNHLCVDLTYDGSVRRIEPYSLRQTAEGYFGLHAIRTDSGEHRSYRVDRMQGATVTSQVFTPRYAIELTSTGPIAVAPSTAIPRVPSMQRAARTKHHGPTYVYRCAVCGKTFNNGRLAESSQESSRAIHVTDGMGCTFAPGIRSKRKTGTSSERSAVLLLASLKRYKYTV